MREPSVSDPHCGASRCGWPLDRNRRRAPYRRLIFGRKHALHSRGETFRASPLVLSVLAGWIRLEPVTDLERLFRGMRLAFVLRLGNDTRPADGFFEGWIEEVDSYTELRFRSTDELLKFLGQRFDLSMTASKQDAAADSKQSAGSEGETHRPRRSQEAEMRR